MKTFRYLPVILALLLAACNKYDIQPEQAKGFIKFFSDTDLNESGVDVKQTPDGGYVAIGNSIAEGSGLSDIYLVKTDQYGNEESWSPVILGGDFDDVATSLQVVSDGYVILGYSKMDADSSYDMYILKTDLQGNKLWENWVEGSEDDRGSNLIATADGGFIASGVTRSHGLGVQNAWLVVFDADGKRVSILNNTAGYSNTTIVDTYITEGEHFYLVSAVLAEDNNRMHLFPVDKTYPSLVYPGVIIPDGSSPNLSINSMEALSGGDFLLCGSVNASSGFSEIYLARFHPASTSVQTTFSIVWETTHESEDPSDQADFFGNSVRVIDDNTFAVIGTKRETGNDDIILLLVDADGNEKSRTYYGDEGFQLGEGLDFTSSDNGLIIVGTNGAEDNSMISLLKTDSSGKL
ncbi:MAG TPA: hypothetical protein ENI20_15855 [Bacteroides sp.]|nr:hypothetical protein [Bacteroides sp.]